MYIFAYIGKLQAFWWLKCGSWFKKVQELLLYMSSLTIWDLGSRGIDQTSQRHQYATKLCIKLDSPLCDYSADALSWALQNTTYQLCV
jgi:hypothetical protein